MKKNLYIIAVFVAIAACSVVAMAQDMIYRCGNEYLNDAGTALARGCKVLEGGNVTVVPGTHVNPLEKAVASPAAASVPARGVRRSAGVNSNPNPDAAAQRARDSDARSILLTELKTAEGRLADQQKQYNHGEPEKSELETRNSQRYQDRVNELRDGINRYMGDIAGLKRELARLPAAVSMPTQPAQ